jgi:hypothetical protein
LVVGITCGRDRLVVGITCGRQNIQIKLKIE